MDVTQLHSQLYYFPPNKEQKICLCVDDFSVEYFSKDDANHIIDSLKKHYEISTDWEDCNYLKLTIYWNYSKEYFNILIPEYVKKSLDRLQHPKPKRPQYDPHRWIVPAYGKILQMAPDTDIALFLTKSPPK